MPSIPNHFILLFCVSVFCCCWIYFIFFFFSFFSRLYYFLYCRWWLLGSGLALMMVRLVLFDQFFICRHSPVDEISLSNGFSVQFLRVAHRTHANNWSEWPYKYVTSLIIIVRAFRAENVRCRFYIDFCLSVCMFYSQIFFCYNVVVLLPLPHCYCWHRHFFFSVSTSVLCVCVFLMPFVEFCSKNICFFFLV